MKDLVGLLASSAYLSLALFSGQFLLTKGILTPKGLRKWLHVLAGSWILPCAYLFEHWYWAVVLPFIFVAVNLLTYRNPPVAFENQEKFGPV